MSGIAVYVPGVDFSQKNLGQVSLSGSNPLSSLSIDGPAVVPGNATYRCKFTPVLTTERSVVWSITSGSQYANISQDGLLTADPSASASSVTIRATSSSNSQIYAEKTVSVTGSLEYCDWLRNEDTALIDIPMTGIGTTTTAMKMTLVCIPETLNGYIMSGSYSSSLGATTLFAYLNSQNKISYRIGSGDYQNAFTKTAGVRYRYVFELSGNNVGTSKCYIYNDETDALLHTSAAANAYLNSDMCLFAWHLNTAGKGSSRAAPQLYCIGKIYGFKVEIGDDVVMNLVPASVSGIGAMVDTVSGTIYYNSNTSGSFTFGND